MDVILQIILNGLLISAIYALIAGGVSFLYATSKIFHLAHGIVVVGAGYAFWWSVSSLGFNFALAAIFSVVIAGVLGFVMNEFVYEPLRRHGTKGLGYLIATLALLMLGTGLLLLLFGAQPKTLYIEPTIFAFAGARITMVQASVIGIAVALLLLFAWVMKRTRFGKAMRATADNETVAEVVGINTRRVRQKAFLFASVLAAAAGILSGIEFNFNSSDGIVFAVKGFTAAVLGGIGSVGGAIGGSLIIGMLEQGVVWFLGSGWRSAVTFILLFIIILWKPTGLFVRNPVRKQ